MKLGDIKKIHVVPYFHHDHAWTNTREWHIWRYLEGYCRALERMGVDEKYRLTIDNVLHSLEIFQRYCPQKMDELRERVAEGRVEIANGGMALMRPSLFDGELFIRNIVESKRVFSDVLGGSDISVFFNADTAVGHSQLPQILKLSGHDYYRFMRPEVSMDGAGIPKEFFWKGLDGTEILASRGPYYGCLYANWSNLPLNNWETVKKQFFEEDISDKLNLSESDELLMCLGMDDALPMTNIHDKEVDFPELMKKWNASGAPQMEYSSFKAYFMALKDKQLPSYEGVIDPCELSYNLPFRAEHALWRKRVEGERLLVMFEKLLVLLESMGGHPDYTNVSAYWKKLMRFSGHAMNFLLGVDYLEVEELANATLSAIREDIHAVTDSIASLVTTHAGMNQHVIINTSSFDVTENVTLHITSPYHVKGLRLSDSLGETIPYQFVETYRGDKEYENCDYCEVDVTCNVHVPAFGYSCVFAEFDGKPICGQAEEHLGKHNSNDCEIDNGIYKIRFVHGMVSRLIRKADEKVLFESGNSKFGTIRLYHTAPTPDWIPGCNVLAADEFVPEHTYLKENGPIRFSVVSKGKIGNHPAQLETVLVQNSDRITYRLSIDNQGAEGIFSAVFPCDRYPQIKAGIPFGEEARNTETIHYGSAGEPLSVERGWNDAFFANGYASYLCNDVRMTLLQGNCNVYYRNNAASCEIEITLMRSILLDGKNGWESKFDVSVSGKGLQTFEYAISLTDTPWKEVTRIRQPVQTVTRFSYFDASQPVTNSMMSTTNTSLILSAAYRNGRAFFFRFFDSSGCAGCAEIEMPIAHKSAAVVDLCGNKIHNLKTDGKSVFFTYHPWEICTIKLTIE